MRWSVVGTIYRREVRDVLRDRRTLFTMLVLPLLLYPVLMLGFTQLTLSRARDLRTREMPVMVRLGDAAVTRDTPAEEGSLLARILAIDSFVFERVEDPGAAIDEGRLRLAVDFPADLEARMAAGEAVELAPLHRSADDASRAALESFRAAVRDYRKNRVPVDVVESGDRASASERGGHAFGGLLAMLVVTMALTGAFYPALDVAAGEKERGTLETLLLSPASREELVLGKFFTVLTVAVAASAANLASMALTFRAFSSMLPGAGGNGGGLQLGFDVTSLSVIFVALVLVAALFSAVTLALSTFARSYKEGQSYLTPVFVVVMPLGMIGMLPDSQLDLGMAILPVANVALMMKALLTGSLPWLEIAVTLGSLLLLTGAVLSWTAGLFSREEVLFREGKQVFGLRPPPGVERPTRPSAGVALLGFFLGFAWFYHVSLRLAPHGISAVLIGVQAGLAAIAILLPTLSMVRWVPGLALSRPATPTWMLGGLIGLLGIPISATIGILQPLIVGDPSETAAEMEEIIQGLLGSHPTIVVILLLSVAPALGEELLFRGLMLQGLRGTLGSSRSVLFVAAAFGIFHADVHRFFPQATLGILLGWLVIRTGSLWPAILAHAVHNAGLVSIELLGSQDLKDWLEADAWVVPVLGAAAGAAAIALLRSGAPPSSSEIASP